MPPLARTVSRFLVFAGLALLAAFSLWDNGPGYTLLWPWHFYAQLVLLAPVVWLAVRGLARGSLARFGGSLDVAFAVFVAAQLAGVMGSAFPNVALAALPIVLLPASLAYALRSWLEDGDRAANTARLHRFAAAATALLNVVALLWWLAKDVTPAFGRVPASQLLALRNLHPLGHWNFTSATGLLGFAWALPLALRAAPGNRAGWVGATLAGILTLLSGGSRGAFVGVGVAALLVLFFEARHRRWSVARMLVAGSLALAVVAGAALAHPRTRSLLADLRASGTLNSGDRQRLAMMEAGKLMVRDRPLTGVGPGAVPRAYPEYRVRVSGGVESALQLHSTPVQLAAESGLPALAAALAVVAFLAFRAARRATEEPAATAALAVIGGYGVFALFDYQLDVPWFGASLAVGAALAAGPGPGIRFPRVFAGIVAAAGAVFLFAIRGPWTARASFSSALEDLFGKNVAAYESGVAEAHAADPRETFYLNIHGLLLLEPQLYFVPVSLGTGDQRFARGRDVLEESLRINPAQETVHFNLGWALLPRDPAAAAGHFLAAARLVPDKGGVYFGLGLARLAQNRAPDAVAAWAVEIANDPAFATSAVWLDEKLRPHAAASRAAAAELLARIAAEAPSADSLGHGRRARCAAAVLRWADGDTAALDVALDAAEPAPREILRWLRGGTPSATVAPAALLSLAEAVTAKSTSAETAVRLRNFYNQFRPALPDETLREVVPFVRAENRRELLWPPSLSPRLLFQQRRERPAYGLLMKNLDAPTVRDLYLVQENRVVHDFLQPLFPEKGYLPGPVLADLQARLAR